MPLYDFKCPAGHVTERKRSAEVAAILCPECFEVADRQLSVPGMIVGPTLHENLGRDPRWQEARERAEFGFRQIGVKRP